MTIVKRGKQWMLMSKKIPGRVLGKHSSEAGAKSQEKAIQLSKARATGHNIPFKKA
jgi:hypothetical protein